MHNVDMIYLMKPGPFWSHTYLGKVDNGAALQKIIAYLSMLFFGYYAQGHLGATCLPNTDGGALYTNDSSVGAINEYGKNFLKY